MNKSVKESVVDGYGKLAKVTRGALVSNLFACCDPQDNAYRVAKKIGYSENILDSVPKGANLGVGCGNPSALANIAKGDTVVDLGSGAGFDAFIVSPIVGNEGRVIGLDLSDEMLNLANENARKGSYSNVSFLKGDIEKIPLENNLANHVISNCVINLSLNKQDVFKEAYRILKDGGRLSVSDVVLAAELPSFIKQSLAGHIACVSGAEKIEDYIGFIEDAGFQNVVIESKSDFPLELMLTDPQVKKLADKMNFSLDSEEAKEIASRVVSVSITAEKTVENEVL